MATFDECFANLPKLADQPKDWEAYWTRQLAKLKKVPSDVQSRRKVSKKLLTENHLFLTYQSAGKERLSAELLAPKKFRKKPPVVIVFPDYHEEAKLMPSLALSGIAQFVIKLRGHERLLEEPVADEETPEKEQSFGYFAENLLQKENYYLNNLFLDAYRTFEVVRQRHEIDSNRVGIWGRGTGAAMAIFVSKFMSRTASLFLEHPSFAHLDLTQNLSKSKYAQEINRFVRGHRKQSPQIKNNLRYFDSLFFSPHIKAPTAMVVNLKNVNSVPQGSFAVFHHIPAEKEMHLFTTDDEKSLRAESGLIAKTSSEFFRKQLVSR